MEFTRTRIALAGILAAGLLIGGTAAVVRHNKPAPPMATAPEASVPGYAGPLYDAQGNLVGYAPSQPAPEPRPASFAAPQAPTGAPAASPARQAAPVAPRGTKRPRSTRKSVAIVAGTAGVGTAIGAIAGGGKGAALGALSGGGAGFVYDRLTRNK